MNNLGAKEDWMLREQKGLRLLTRSVRRIREIMMVSHGGGGGRHVYHIYLEG